METVAQDSRPDTLAHIARVAELLKKCEIELNERACAHDESKLEEPEKSAFDRLKALSLSGMAYGSEEYRACLRAEKPAIEHHYKANSHHPEFYDRAPTTLIGEMLRATALAQKEQAMAAELHTDEKEAAAALVKTAEFIEATADQLEAQVNGMNLFDVMEMLMDWKAATERMKGGGDIRASLIHNTDRFKLSPQLANILSNTIREMGW
jgi:hypothetical protein